MRFTSLILGVSALALFAKANEGSGAAPIVETDNDDVNGGKIELTQADVDNVNRMVEDSKMAVAGTDSEPWSKMDILQLAHAAVLAGIYGSISESLADGREKFDQMLGELSVDDYIAGHPQSEDIADSADDFYFADDVDDDLIIEEYLAELIAEDQAEQGQQRF